MRHAEKRNTRQATKDKRLKVKVVKVPKDMGAEEQYDWMYANYAEDVKAGLFADDDDCSYEYEGQWGAQMAQQENNGKRNYNIRLTPCRNLATKSQSQEWLEKEYIRS